MNKRSYRRFTTDEKRMILTEVQQPGVTLSEVCRKHSVSPALVYRWRAVAQQATTQALQKVDSRGKTPPDAQTARLQAELDRMRRVVAEITAENLELKENSRTGRSRSAHCGQETGGFGLGRAHAATVAVASFVHPLQLGIAAQRLL
jgi:transposase